MHIRAWFASIDWAAIIGSALVLAFALLVFVPLVSAPERAHEPQYRDCACEDDYPRVSEPAPKGFIERTVEDPVAAFTGALALFTLVLTVVSFIQIRFLINADKTATESAKAAKTAADRVLRVDRPFLLNIAIKLGSAHFQKQPNGAYYLELTCIGRNCGTRPGITRSVGVAYALDELPAKMPPLVSHPTAEFGVLEPNDVAEFETPLSMQIPPGDVARITAGKSRFYVYGYFRYSDMHGIKRRSGFAYEYRVSPAVGYFLMKSGPDMYWYDTEEN